MRCAASDDGCGDDLHAGGRKRMVMLQQAHEALVRGLNKNGSALILERTDEDFVGGTLADLGRGLDEVRKSRAKDRTKDNYLKLYQPVQRTFHLALFDIACD